MVSPERLRAELGAVLVGRGGPAGSADRLCHACVDLLEVDGAAVSVVHDGAVHGTFGSSGEMSRMLDELQFTFGEGPCLEAVRQKRPVFVDNFNSADEHRWPAFSKAVVRSGVGAIAAFPIRIAGLAVGALDLFRNSTGALSERNLAGAAWAAELAALPLLSLISETVDWDTADDDIDGWSRLASLERIEVYQATGMVMAQLNVGPAEALVRLRAHAFANELTASEVAWSIVERGLALDADDGRIDTEEGPLR